MPPNPRPTIAVLLTLLGGTALLAWALRTTPGDPAFLIVTAVLAVVWTAGAWFAGRPAAGTWPARGSAPSLSPAGRSGTPERPGTTMRPERLGTPEPHGTPERSGTPERPGTTIGRGVLIGLALVALFLAGAVLVAPVPGLSGPVDDLLTHATGGPLGAVIVLTALTAIAEELFFRGALYDALPDRHAVLASTALYTAVTAVSGVVLLVFAAAVLGAVAGLLRRHTGGVLAPAAAHLTWSVAMVLLLPVVLELLR